MEKFLIEIQVRKKIHTSEGNKMLEIDIQIPEHEFVSVFGKSGVGKTTILRMIAGLTYPDSGTIKVNDEIWFDSKAKINLKPQRRNIGFVFQDYALFPNMTVKEHLLFAQPTISKLDVSALLDVFHLKGLCNRKPAKLSGGQQQRLAVARAFARKPQILLLDEPLSALDFETRLILQDEIFLAHKNFKATTLLVSHDVEEVTKLSDFVYVIDDGKIQNQGKPKDIFNKNLSDSTQKIVGKVIKIERNLVTLRSDDTDILAEVSNEQANTINVNDFVTITLEKF